MKEGTFLERLAENILEGSFARAFKTKLQPVQIAKALTKAMERTQVVGVDAPLVANQYVAYLHPDDLAGLAGFQASLERELASYLKGYAARRGLKLLSPPSVRLLSSPSPGRPGRVRVDASLADDGPAAAVYPSPMPHSPNEGTVEMPAVQVAAPPTITQSQALLVDEAGHAFDLGRAETSIGRAIDNDIVLEATGISRHHARIVREAGRYLLVDLDSTNGSFVSGLRVTRHVLSEGEQVSFAGTGFTFRIGDHTRDGSRYPDC